MEGVHEAWLHVNLNYKDFFFETSNVQSDYHNVVDCCQDFRKTQMVSGYLPEK